MPFGSTRKERAFHGSKKRSRLIEFDNKIVDRETRKLRMVRLMAQRLTSRYELEAYLTKTEDPILRAAVRTMVLSFRPDLKEYR